MTEKLLNEDDRSEIEALLLGRRVVDVEGINLTLDNGVVIEALGHEGGCSCSAGDYDVRVLNRVDNAITRVEFDYRPSGDYADWTDEGARADWPVVAGAHPDDPPADSYEGFYRIFVYAEHEQINLMQFNGSDGNGYYGTGFELRVRVPE